MPLAEALEYQKRKKTEQLIDGEIAVEEGGDEATTVDSNASEISVS